MTIARLYVPRPHLREGDLIIEGNDHHYLSRVLRMRRGEEVRLFDGDGIMASGCILEVNPQVTVIKVGKLERFEPETPNLHLYQALLQAGKMDKVVQDCIEAGVSSVVPFSCRRSKDIASLAPERMDRWRRISTEAWRLTGRPYRPLVADPVDWEQMLIGLAGLDRVLYADEKGGRRPTDVLGEGQAHAVALLIGPEGGFCNEERDDLAARGASAVTLGKGIFRAEMAGVVLAVAARCHYGLL